MPLLLQQVARIEVNYIGTAPAVMTTIDLQDFHLTGYIDNWCQGLEQFRYSSFRRILLRPPQCVVVLGAQNNTCQTIFLYSASIFSAEDRKSTRLNSSHSQISYAVFCLKKK